MANEQMLKEFEKKMAQFAVKNNLEFVKCSPYHFHLKGVFLVNIYPTRMTYYVQGTNGKSQWKYYEDLVEVATGTSEKHLKGIAKGVRKAGKSKVKRQRIWALGNRNCFVCGKEFLDFEETTLEHKIPLSRGGSNRRDNLALSHEECNKVRGSNIGISRE